MEWREEVFAQLIRVEEEGCGGAGAAFPRFVQVVLGGFVAFPVVAGAEAFVAVGEGAAIGAGVAFFVFSVDGCEYGVCGTEGYWREVYFRSQSRGLILSQCLHLNWRALPPEALCRGKV